VMACVDTSTTGLQERDIEGESVRGSCLTV